MALFMNQSTEPLVIETHSPADTERLGQALAALLPRGTVVALRGELATGKTCFVRGMAAHFAKDAPVRSPTFTLVNEYGDSTKLYHLDLYRIGGVKELADLGYEELFDSDDGVCAVEWAERAGPLLPERRVDIYLEHLGEHSRRLAFVDAGVLPEGWRETLKRPLEPGTGPTP